MNEDNVNGYGCFATVIAGVALLIALVALRRWDIPLCALNSSDFNVADVLSILVTILIAGQLWQSFVTREDLKKINRAVEAVERLKQEVERTRELPEGIMWSLRAVRSQSDGTANGNRLAIQFYAESLKHLVLAQADYNNLIRNSLIGMRTCITNLRNMGADTFTGMEKTISENLDVAETSISMMNENLSNAFNIMAEIRNIHQSMFPTSPRPWPQRINQITQ